MIVASDLLRQTRDEIEWVLTTIPSQQRYKEAHRQFWSRRMILESWDQLTEGGILT